MSNRTDLALESPALISNTLPQGVELTRDNSGSILIEHVKITTNTGAKAIGKPIGNYITITTPELAENRLLEDEDYGHIAKQISALIPKEGGVLVVGLGNIHITPDAIGPLAVDKVIASRYMTIESPIAIEGFRAVAVMATGVLGQTGMETVEIIKSLVDSIKPVVVIAIDALAASSLTRLGCTIQIADSGISPGSGVQNRRKELSKATLGVPVIAIGIPTVIEGEVMASEITTGGERNPITEEPLMMTTRDVDLMVTRGAKIISDSINIALQPQLTLDEIRYLNA